MEIIKAFLINKELCDSNFLLYIDSQTDFINPLLIDCAGCYFINNQLKIKVPKIINDYTRSITVHELGHLYDYYINNELIKNEDNALLWELLYLKYSHNEELLLERIEKIKKDINNPHYKSLQKIKEAKPQF